MSGKHGIKWRHRMTYALRGLSNLMILVGSFSAGGACGLLILAEAYMHQYGYAVLFFGLTSLWGVVHWQQRIIARLRVTIIKSTEHAYQLGLKGRKIR